MLGVCEVDLPGGAGFFTPVVAHPGTDGFVGGLHLVVGADVGGDGGLAAGQLAGLHDVVSGEGLRDRDAGVEDDAIRSDAVVAGEGHAVRVDAVALGVPPDGAEGVAEGGSGLVGWMAMWPIWNVSRRPMHCQLVPPSIDL